jgi:hypothetical protein
MPKTPSISALIPKKYGKPDLSFLESGDLNDVETGLRTLGVQSSVAWLVTSIVLWKVIYQDALFKTSGFDDWRAYRNECRIRLGMDSREMTEYLAAGRFLALYGKELAARDWNPERSARKVARAELALKLCGDSGLVIDHLVEDTWPEFNAWYKQVRTDNALPEPKRRKKTYEVIIRKGKVFVDGREPVQIADDVPEQEKKDLAKLVRDYYLEKGK